MNMIDQDTYYHTTELIERTFDLLAAHIGGAHFKDVLWDWSHMLLKLDEVLVGDGVVDYHTYLRRLSELEGDVVCFCEHLTSEADYAATSRGSTSSRPKSASSSSAGSPPAPSAADRARRPAMIERTLFENAFVVSMDPTVGDLHGCSILVEDGTIAAIGRYLSVSDAEIVDCTDCIAIPGFVDTHRHTWQTNVRVSFRTAASTSTWRRCARTWASTSRPRTSTSETSSAASRP